MFEIIVKNGITQMVEIQFNSLIVALQWSWFIGKDWDIQHNNSVIVKYRFGEGITAKAKIYEILLNELTEITNLFLNKEVGFATLRNATQTICECLPHITIE